MPYLRVNPALFDGMCDTVQNCAKRVGQIKGDFSMIGKNLDWDIRSASDISRRIDRVESSLENEEGKLSRMQQFLSFAKKEYSEITAYEQKIRKLK